MRARPTQVVVVFFVLIAAVAAKDESLDALKARAFRENQPRLYAEVVRRQVEVANDYFVAGQVDKAQAAVAEIIDFTGKCVAAAQKNHSKLKDTEITLYRAGRRLDDVRRSLNYDDQPPVQAAVDRIEKARRDLLNLMFRDPDKPQHEAKTP